MQVLGAVLAGGASRRFGGDKAPFEIEGTALIDHCIWSLQKQCDMIVICGRMWRDWPTVADRPAGGAGPLAGLNAALHYANAGGYGAVMTAPVDVYPLPSNFAVLLRGEHAAVFADQHLIGWWPVTLADQLDRFLTDGGRAVHRWIDHVGARRVADPPGLTNINHREDVPRLG
jgi:molybdenum cofactor guanylyltransferase